MRRRLLFLLFIPKLLLLPVTIYVQLRPGVASGLIYGRATGDVRKIDPRTPVAATGIQQGDRLISWDGMPLRDYGNVAASLIRAPEDALHTLEFEHEGVRRTGTFRMERIWGPAEKAYRITIGMALPVFLAAGLLLWFAGKGSPSAEYAGAYFIVVASWTPDPGNWFSLGPLLQLYPWHLGEAAFVLSCVVEGAGLFLLPLMADSISQSRPAGSAWRFVAGGGTLLAAGVFGWWAVGVLRDGVPNWLFWFAEEGAFLYVVPLYSLGTLFLLFLHLRAAADVNERRRIRLLLAGLLPLVLGTVLIVVALFQRIFALLPVVMLLFACFPAAVLYALLKHRLFDVSVIIRRGLQYALTRASIGVMAGLILFFMVVLPFLENIERPISELLAQKRFLFGVAVLGLLMAKHQQIRQALDKRFFRDAYDPREVHLEVARLLAKRDDLERDGRQIAAILSRALHADYGALLLRPSRVLLAGEPRELQPLPKTSRIPGLLEITGKPLEVDLAERKSFLHQLPEDDQALLRAWKAGALAPIGDAKVEAILLLGEKLSEQPYSGEDLKLIQAVAMDFTAAYFTGVPARQHSGDRMRECPRCQTCYSEETEVCPTDGAALLDSALSLAVAGRYRLQRRLGAGGMGVVYQATDSELGRTVAVKVIRPESVADAQTLERFRREARASASLSHPNIVAVYDFGTLPGGGAFLVMEYVEGQSLRQMMPLAPPQALEILTGVVAALETAHQAGLIHRDLKPDNVMVSSARVKVLDFGLAKNLSANEETLTQEGRLAGTLAYMAPEQLYGGAVDARTDIYALGVVAHEMLTGRRPEHGQSLYAAVRRALSSQPSQRPASVREFLNELQANLL
jgi:predicted Ser/Thr protein kinase